MSTKLTLHCACNKCEWAVMPWDVVWEIQTVPSPTLDKSKHVDEGKNGSWFTLWVYILYPFETEIYLHPQQHSPFYVNDGCSGGKPELCMTLDKLPDFSVLPLPLGLNGTMWIGPIPYSVVMGGEQYPCRTQSWSSCDSAEAEWKTKRTLSTWTGTVASLSPVS